MIVWESQVKVTSNLTETVGKIRNNISLLPNKISRCFIGHPFFRTASSPAIHTPNVALIASPVHLPQCAFMIAYPNIIVRLMSFELIAATI